MNRHSFLTGLFLVLMLLVTASLGVASTSSYYLDTSRLEVTASPKNGAAVGVIRVSSNSDRMIRLRVVPKLWELNAQGVLGYIDPPESGYNLLDNISVNPREFDLMPGKF